MTKHCVKCHSILKSLGHITTNDGTGDKYTQLFLCEDIACERNGLTSATFLTL